MKPTAFSLAAALAVAATLSGCASAPGRGATQVAAAPSDCQGIDRQMAQIQQERRAGLDRQEGAWKAVVPFAVAGRFMRGKAAVSEADQQLAHLQAAAHRQGCTGHGH